MVLGIDGGGTRTRAWIARENGAVLARGAAGASNVHRLGVDASRRVIVEAVAAAWKELGGPGERPCGFRSVFAGVAGAGTAESQRALATALAAEFGVDPKNSRADHDLRIALAGALRGAPGAVIVAGTGSACFGATLDGRTWKAGGWGPLLDDGGSGRWLGYEALRTAIRAADGRGPESTLIAVVSEQTGLCDPRAIIEGLSSGQLGPDQVAALAPQILEAAVAGDAVAHSILERGAVELATMAAAVWSSLRFVSDSGAALAGTGSLLLKSDLYRDLCGAAISRVLPDVALVRPSMPAVAGAVLLALQVAGFAANRDVLTKLASAGWD